MKRKTNELITVEENNAIKVSNENDAIPLVLGDYFNIHTFQKHPITSNFMIQEAMRLKQWSELDTSLRLSDFYDEQGYSPKVFYEWVKKHQEMEFGVPHCY